MTWCICSDAVQSLMFWAGVPVVWMLVTLLIIIMYFCYRCCQREVEKSTPCIKWAIGILALLSWQVSENIVRQTLTKYLDLQVIIVDVGCFSCFWCVY